MNHPTLLRALPLLKRSPRSSAPAILGKDFVPQVAEMAGLTAAANVVSG